MSMAVDRETFQRMLRDKGLKVTSQRLKVLEAMQSCPEGHLSAEEIHAIVRADCPNVGLATIYRTIQLLNELHLVDRISFDDGFVRYEMGSAPNREQKHRHHHLICKKCGRVFSFRDDLLEGLEEKIADTAGFLVVDHEVKLYGYCMACRESLRPKDAGKAPGTDK